MSRPPDARSRPSLTPASLVSWLAESLRTLPGTVRHGLNLRTRQQVSLVVAEANASRPWIWAHEAWRDFLGPVVVDEEILAYAQACAGGGRPVETVLPSGVRATVARAELASLAANGAEAMGERMRGRRPWYPADTAWDTGVALVALPLTVPALAAAGLVRAAARLAPPVPVVEVGAEDEANLLVAVLAHSVPQLLGNAAVRTALLACRPQSPSACGPGKWRPPSVSAGAAWPSTTASRETPES